MPHISLFLLAIILASAVYAAPDWQACKNISADAERLRCYDDHALALDGKTSEPDIEAQKATFGLPKTSPADDLPAIGSRIMQVEKASRGSRIVYLENEQVWHQVGSSSQPSLKKGDIINIKRGALGSFVLKKQGANRGLRVKRIQ